MYDIRFSSRRALAWLAAEASLPLAAVT
jgi:hypothetical protein